MGDLPQIFGSLAVGFFTVIVIFTFIVFLFVPGKSWVFFTTQLKNNLKQKGSLHLSFLGSSLILPMIYGLGYIIQDYTDYLTDREHEFRNRPRLECNLSGVNWSNFLDVDYISRLCLGGESELRAKAILERVGIIPNGLDHYDLNSMRTGGYYEFKFNSLGDELVKTGLLKMPDIKAEIPQFEDRKYDNDIFCVFNDRLNLELGNLDVAMAVETCTQSKTLYPLSELEGEIVGIYYDAKNWAYRENINHFMELAEIQRRIDFSRSIFLVTMYGLYFFVIAIFFRIIYFFIRLAITKERILPYQRGYIVTKYKTVGFVLLAYLFIACIAPVGYRNAELVYNERVFGYYVSMIKFRAFNL